jgi:hypothetical protein
MVYGVDGSGVDAASFRSFLRLALPVVACRYLFFSTFSTRVPYIRRTRIAKDRQVDRGEVSRAPHVSRRPAGPNLRRNKYVGYVS